MFWVIFAFLLWGLLPLLLALPCSALLPSFLGPFLFLCGGAFFCSGAFFPFFWGGGWGWCPPFQFFFFPFSFWGEGFGALLCFGGGGPVSALSLLPFWPFFGVGVWGKGGALFFEGFFVFQSPLFGAPFFFFSGPFLVFFVGGGEFFFGGGCFSAPLSSLP